MRFWHAAAFVLIACGGKIATESTGGTTKQGPGPSTGDDDDDVPTASSGYYTSSSGYFTGSSSDLIGTSSGYGTSGYSSSGYTSSGSASSSGTLCGAVNAGCVSNEQSYKCSIDGPPGTPSIQCFGVSGQPTVKCNCYGTYRDAGTATFEVKVPDQASVKDLYYAWQTYCGGACK